MLVVYHMAIDCFSLSQNYEGEYYITQTRMAKFIVSDSAVTWISMIRKWSLITCDCRCPRLSASCSTLPKKISILLPVYSAMCVDLSNEIIFLNANKLGKKFSGF